MINIYLLAVLLIVEKKKSYNNQMKKIFLYVFLILMFCNVGFADHQVDHWVNLKCKHHDGSGDIEIKFDKASIKSYVKLNYDWEVIVGRFIKLTKNK